MIGFSLSMHLHAEPRLAPIFQDHMVLQQGVSTPVWGTARPRERLTVEFGQQIITTTADVDGRWMVHLAPLQPGPPRVLRVAGAGGVEIADVVVGEVWLCSGQSNMGWTLAAEENGDLELLGADRQPDIRLLTVRNAGSQTPTENIFGAWSACNGQTAGQFSAVGYYFGRRLHAALGVPIGLIDNSWGGSSAEAWVARDLLETRREFASYLGSWKVFEESFDLEEARREHVEGLAQWRIVAEQARAKGHKAPWYPEVFVNPMTAQHRPGNLYNGRIKPLVPFAFRGVAWYQGESNACRAGEYAALFRLLISSWRKEWGRGDFPFYWVQLANAVPETEGLGIGNWAALREAQTMALELPETGQAIAIDVGEGNDLHPRNKRAVADRLARIALARTYGFNVPFLGPEPRSAEIRDGKVVVRFEHIGQGLVPVGDDRIRGFVIAGENQVWHPALAELIALDTVQAWGESVPRPAAIRYAWEDDPDCNLYNSFRLPAAPFRIDRLKEG